MADTLSAKKKKEYKDAFALFDKNGDGKISKDELRAVAKNLKLELNDEELQALMKSVDKNNTGYIEYHEFEQMMIDSEKQKIANLEVAFKEIDKDGSGFIDLKELDKMFKDVGLIMTEAELKKEMADVDQNKDQKISLEEFKKVMANV